MTFEQRQRAREIRRLRRHYAMPGFDIDHDPLMRWSWSLVPSVLHRARSIAALVMLAGCWVGQAPLELEAPAQRAPRDRHATCDVLPLIVGEVPDEPTIDCWSSAWDPALVDYCLFIRWRDHARELRAWTERAIGLCGP